MESKCESAGGRLLVWPAAPIKQADVVQDDRRDDRSLWRAHESVKRPREYRPRSAGLVFSAASLPTRFDPKESSNGDSFVARSRGARPRSHGCPPPPRPPPSCPCPFP